jgi:D-alanine transaminase
LNVASGLCRRPVPAPAARVSHADNAILNGVTRLAALDIIRREGYGFVERPFSVAEAKLARAAFLTSTVLDLLPVVSIDNDPV